MTEAEERLYLEELLLESARWTRDPDESYCSVELEIRDRLRKLNGVNTVDSQGLTQSVVERGLAKAAARKSRETHPGKIRIYENGNTRWVSRELCEQVPCIHSKTKMKWVLKKEVQNEP